MCEIDPVKKNIIRIFRSQKRAFDLEPEQVIEYPRSEAVKSIRQQIFTRCEGRCEYCNREITWQEGEMHEEIPRGKSGEISLANSRFVCPKCHRNDERGHKSRRLYWGESV